MKAKGFTDESSLRLYSSRYMDENYHLTHNVMTRNIPPGCGGFLRLNYIYW